jgi:hypothetical protein
VSWLPLAKIAAEGVSRSADAMEGKMSGTVAAAARAKGSHTTADNARDLLFSLSQPSASQRKFTCAITVALYYVRPQL